MPQIQESQIQASNTAFENLQQFFGKYLRRARKWCLSDQGEREDQITRQDSLHRDSLHGR